VVTKRDKGPTRKAAIRLLQQGHDEVGQLLDRLPKRAFITGGLGGGEWSPKDLVGHLESWEEYSLEALDAWEAGHGPEIDKVFRSESTATVNRQAVERKASRSGPEMRRHAEATHRTLIVRLEAMTDQRWRKPGTRRGRKSVGERLGGLLGGPAGPFRHAEAHLKDLEAFVERHGR
jgi:hypothetical protein